MLKCFTISFILLFCFDVNGWPEQVRPDRKINIISVDSTIAVAYAARLKFPEQTIKLATAAFAQAKSIGYVKGQAEACRTIGIGQYYLSNYEGALDKYLQGIAFFEQANDEQGVGKVYNNIGNLYLLNDYDKALLYYKKALVIAEKYQAKSQLAGLYLNIGNVIMKKRHYKEALSRFKTSMELFKQLNTPIPMIQCLQNMGDGYTHIKEYQKAELVLNQALAEAKSRNLTYTTASIYLTVSDLYLSLNEFADVEKTLAAGFDYAKDLNNRDLENDYKYEYFKLEYKRKNYQLALNYLKQNFSQDSAYYRQSFSKKISLATDLYNQLETQRKNERIIAQQKFTKVLFWGTLSVSLLLTALVFLLSFYAQRTNRSNKELTMLHVEVSKQKENLDLINQNLEHIINMRTKDLKEKNAKLSDYSLHLSHHIRGPIATLKGIVYLEENDMIGKDECISLITKCVFGIDDEIISMSKMLNEDPSFDPDKI